MESSIVQLAKQIGSLEQRMDSIEKYIVALSKLEESTESYPFEVDFNNIKRATVGEIRSIYNSIYDVYITIPIKDQPNELPFLLMVSMTRVELDAYLNGHHGHTIYKITPSYEKYI